MPELPEVQTIVNDLKKKIVGRKIKNLWTDWPKYFKHLSEKDFKKYVIGKKIIGVERRAKNILFYLSNNYLMLVHQKLSGHLLYGKWQMVKSKEQGAKSVWQSAIRGPLLEDRNNQYIRLVFFLDNGQMLALSDLRRFAKVLCGKREDVFNLPDLKKLGPEPMEAKFTFNKFKELFKNKRGRIKQVLMDPNFISGIGNIYSDEILWLAKIHPLARAEELSGAELKSIYQAMRKILKKALKLRGSSIDDYRDALGRRGRYDLVLSAYQREGELCKRCRTKIKRLKIGGRSAHYCPKCQKI